jgi:hypothetical protein
MIIIPPTEMCDRIDAAIRTKLRDFTAHTQASVV